MSLTSDTPASKPNRLIPLAVFVVAFAAFLPALFEPFSEFDDPGVIAVLGNNRDEGLGWVFTSTALGHYQPLTWITYTIDLALFGLNPAAFHFTNLLIHAINAVLVYFLALRLLRIVRNGPETARAQLAMGPLQLAATAGAILFAIHPLRVESVAWVTERRDVLSTLFLLCATLCYLRYAQTSGETGWVRWYIATFAFLLLSLLSKAWGMTFFVVVLILDWYPLARLPGAPWRWVRRPAVRVLLEKIPFAVLCVAFAAQAARAQAWAPETVHTLSKWPIEARVAQGAYGLSFYLWKLIWPTNLSALYELPRSFNPREMRWALGAAGTFVLLGLAVALRKRMPAFTAAALAYAVLVSPVLGIFQSGIQLVADRYSYVASIPWAVLIGAGVVQLPGLKAPNIRRAALIGSCVIAAIFFVGSWRQTELWRDTALLFKHALDIGEDGPLLHGYYATQLQTKAAEEVSQDHPDVAAKLNEAALLQFDRSLELDSSHGAAWFGRGSTLKALGRFQEAEESLRKASDLMPDGWRADVVLGIMYDDERVNRLTDAKAALEKAIARVEAPDSRSFSPRPYVLLAGVLYEMGDDQGCRKLLKKAAEFRETRDEALAHLKELGG